MGHPLWIPGQARNDRRLSVRVPSAARCIENGPDCRVGIKQSCRTAFRMTKTLSFPQTTHMASKNPWLKALLELLTTLFKAGGKQSRTRTWHQHVVPYEDGWAVRREGNERITSKHRKQSTAINKAKTLARKHQADVIIHREDGTIRDRIGFGED